VANSGNEFLYSRFWRGQVIKKNQTRKSGHIEDVAGRSSFQVKCDDAEGWIPIAVLNCQREVD